MKSTEFNDYQKQKLISLRSVSPDTGCWEYTRSTAKQGYGQIWFNGRSLHVHRVSYAMFNGDIPDDLMVRHKCDNRKCFNPEHLELGTNTDNMQDVRNRGYSKVVTGRGEEHYNSKLTNEDVMEMRRLVREEHLSAAEVGRRYNYDTANAARIVTGEIWGHVPGALGLDWFSNEAKARRVIDSGEKYCKLCDSMVPLDKFGKDKNSLDGYSRRCRPCTNKRANRNYKERKETA